LRAAGSPTKAARRSLISSPRTGQQGRGSARIASAIVTSLFREDIDHMRRKVEAYNEPELAGTLLLPESERS
jgi:hypothetical protein